MTTKKILFVVLLALAIVIATPSVAVVYAQTSVNGTVPPTTPQLPIDDLTLTICMLVAVAGTLTAAGLGWLASNEAFDARTFAYSVLHAVVAGVIIVVGYSFRSTVDWFDFALIFLSGAGVDVTLNRIEGAIAAQASTGNSSTPTPPAPPAPPQGSTQQTAAAPTTPAKQPQS